MDSTYLYSGLDAQTSALALELESLGGGDAALGRFEVHAVIDERLDPREKSSAKVLWVHGKTVGIRDAFLPKSAASADSMAYASVSSTSKFSTFVQNPAKSPLDPQAIVSWVLDGFNACVLSYGSRGVGKSLAFFGQEVGPVLADPMGPGSVAPQAQAYDSPSLAATMLRQLYEQSGLPRSSTSSVAPSLQARLKGLEVPTSDSQHVGGHGTTVGISCWAVHAGSVVDLCRVQAAHSFAPLADKGKPREHCVIECPSLDAALAVVAAARERSAGVHTHGRAPVGKKAPAVGASEAQRGHFFLRVVVHRESTRDLSRTSSLSQNTPASLLSHLHVVDLLGTAPPEADPQFARLPEADRIARREHALQLQAFTRTLGQIRNVARASANVAADVDPRDASVPTVTSGRDSVLTSILAPILQGNCKTAMVLFLKDGEKHYRASKAALLVCDGMSGLLQPCHRVSGVPKAALGMRSADTVLPPYVPSDSARDRLRKSPPTASEPAEEPSSSSTEASGAALTSLDDSVAEFRQLDLIDVAGGAVDGRSPARGTAELRRLAGAFEEELSQQRNKVAGGEVQPAEAAQKQGAAQSGFSYTQFVAPSAKADTTAATKPKFQAAPMQIIKGVYRCIYDHGAWIKSTPGVNAENAGELDEGDVVEMSGVIAMSSDSPRVQFAQLVKGGWVRVEKDGVPVLMHLDPVAAVPVSRPQTAPLSPLPGAKGSPLKSGNPLMHPLSPVPASLSLISHAIGVEKEAVKSKHLDVAPPSIHLNMRNVVAQIMIGSKLKLKAKAAKARVAAAEKEEEKKELRAAVGADFKKQLTDIYTVYNPDKLSSIPEIISNFEGKELQLLHELHRKYNIHDDHVHLLGHESEEDELAIKATVVYPYGCFIRSSAHCESASVGELDVNSAVELTGRQYCPPHEDDVTYAEICLTNNHPSGWVPITARTGGRVLEIPGYDYERMRWPDSRGASPAYDPEGSGSGSDSSVRHVIHRLAAGLKESTPNKHPDKNITPEKSDSPLRRSPSPPFESSPAKEDQRLSAQSAHRTSPSSAPRSPPPAVLAASPASPIRSTAQAADVRSVRIAPTVPTGIGQPDKTSVLALSEAGVRALSMAHAAAGVVAPDSPIKPSPLKAVPTRAGAGFPAASDSRDTSYITVGDSSMSMHSAGATTVAGEVEALRRNTASLMEALNYERVASDKAQAELRGAQVEAEEARTLLDLAREDHQLVERRLKIQLKATMNERGYLSVFSIYEEDLDRAHTEKDLLRKRNMTLELHQAEFDEDRAVDNFHRTTMTGKNIVESVDASVLDAMRGYRASGKLRKLQHENEQLVQEMASLRKQKRQYALGLKITQDVGDKLKVVMQKNAELCAALDDARDAAKTAHANYASLRDDRKYHSQTAAELSAEREALQEEVQMLRLRVKEVDEERWRQAHMDIESHIPDLLPTEGGSAAGTGVYMTDIPSYAMHTTSSRSGRTDDIDYPAGTAAVTLEQAMSELHEGLVAQAPYLLPLLRRLGNSIHYERTRHIKNRADLLSVVYPLEGGAVGTAVDPPTDRFLLDADSFAVRSINSRRNYKVDVAAHYSNIQRNGGMLLYPTNSTEEKNSSPKFQASTGGIDTGAALAALRSHRKQVRDAHTMRAQPFKVQK